MLPNPSLIRDFRWVEQPDEKTLILKLNFILHSPYN